MKGRGASENPVGRFETLSYEPDPEIEAPTTIPTQFFKDPTRSILTRNESPDLGFSYTVNPYRGCEHGCIYCYARPTHEFLGMSAGLDFESRILVKENAPALLREALMAKAYEPDAIGFSGITDCYQPVERTMKITRACLEVLTEFRNPVFIITKNALVTRDIDLLRRLAAQKACSVTLSLTTLDDTLCAKMEPRTSRPTARLAAIQALAQAGIPVGVNLAPVIPGLTESEIPALLKAAREAGAQYAGYGVLRLPYSVKDLFEKWLAEHFPDRKGKVLSHIRDIRGGKLNDPRFGTRMKGEGEYAKQIEALFKVHARKLRYKPFPELNTGAFQRPAPTSDQLSFF